MTMRDAQKLAHKTLSPKRYRHTKNVAQMARSLALCWGQNPAKAQLAGWLHDIVKEKPKEELLQILAGDGIIAKSVLERPVPVWHGPVGALYARDTLGVRDEAVLSAIACHTTGSADMSVLDKVLYVADAVSAERDTAGVQALRALARRDLDAAALAVMQENLADVRRKAKPLDTHTLAAARALQKQIEAREACNTAPEREVGA